MGVAAACFDPGDAGSVDKLFDKGDADVIFAETVSNTPFMPVLNVPHLLERLREAGDDGPILVLDNTLPLSTGINFEEHLTEEDRVLIVESATKSAMHNSEHLGVAYSANESLIDGFRRHKVTKGLVTSVNANKPILNALEATTPGFHERNRALYESTGILATWVAAAQAAKGMFATPDFDVAFPEVPRHPNYDYAARHLPDGVSPVVFVDRASMQEGAAEEFLKKLEGHPDVQEQLKEGQVYFGQSFGFKEATLLYDPNATQIRIAGGYDIDSRALGKALFNALVEIE
jgi:cystathionine beta-lyase/cystathionine gamma-synthase